MRVGWLDRRRNGEARVRPFVASSQWITPLQAREAGEIGVVGMHFRLMLHRNGGDMSVCDQIGASCGEW